MISKTATTGCYVYVTPPEESEPVTAGRFELTRTVGDRPLGRFVFGRSYLARHNAVDLDPVELKLGKNLVETAALQGIFGALRDAGPDYWGRCVIDRHVGGQLSELDYLLHSPDDRAGALGFGLGQKPPAPRRKFNKTLDLEKLQAIADSIVRDEDLSPEKDGSRGEAAELLLVATSMGGARPKTVIEDRDGLWLAKFNRPDDKWNVAKVERAMLVLARNCGLTAAESRLAKIGDRDVLLVKRFDREKARKGYLRARMVSGLTLLQAEDTAEARERWSYIELAEELRRASAEPKKDTLELFGRICFNALISNTDDHPRNHAIIAKRYDWRLSPAYDLTPTPHISVERRDLAMICGDQGRYANAENLKSQSARFLLKPDETDAMIDRLEAQVKETWYAVMRAEGVSENDCERLKGAFVYPGFRYRRAT